MTAPGWYPLDNDPTRMLYFDGQNWVGTPVPNPNVLPQQPKSFNSLQNTPINYASPGTPGAPEANQQYAGNNTSWSQTTNFSSNQTVNKVTTIFRLIPLAFISIVFMVIGFVVLPNVLAPRGPSSYEIEGTATVISMDYDSDGYCLPQISLNPESPETVVPLRMNVKSSPCEYQIGDQVDVYYVEGRPETARPVAGSSMSFVFPLVFGGIGTFLFLTVIFGAFKLIRKKKEEPQN